MKNRFILIRGPRLLWAQLKASLWSLAKFERIVTYSQEKSFKLLPWFPVLLNVALIESEVSKKVFWSNPSMSPAEIQDLKSTMDNYRKAIADAVKSEGL